MNSKTESYPQVLSEVMYDEIGTKVLITNTAADLYLKKAAQEKEVEEEKSE